MWDDLYPKPPEGNPFGPGGNKKQKKKKAPLVTHQSVVEELTRNKNLVVKPAKTAPEKQDCCSRCGYTKGFVEKYVDINEALDKVLSKEDMVPMEIWTESCARCRYSRVVVYLCDGGRSVFQEIHSSGAYLPSPLHLFHMMNDGIDPIDAIKKSEMSAVRVVEFEKLLAPDDIDDFLDRLDKGEDIGMNWSYATSNTQQPVGKEEYDKQYEQILTASLSSVTN